MHGDCSVVERGVAFVFTRNLGGSTRRVCEVAAHEVGHVLGLDHEVLCQDPMTYLGGCGEKTFQDTWASCGEYSPRGCMCGAQQNTALHLLETLGPDGPTPTGDVTPPVVAVLSPADGASLPADTTVHVEATATDETGLGTVELLWVNGGSTFDMDCAAPPAEVTCNRAGDRFHWLVPASTGTRTFAVRATDAAGNTTTTPTRTITLEGGTPPPPPPPEDTTPPAVAIVSPADGEVLAGDGNLTITATITDDTAVAGRELLWQYTGTVAMSCASPPSEVTCTVSGDTVRWFFPVGTGSRSFAVRATDAAGHTTTTPTRTITLEGSAPPPPPDDLPQVTIDAPLAGQTVSPGGTLSVRVTATADGGVAQVWLLWGGPAGDVWYQLHALGGTTFGTDLMLSTTAAPGPRTLRVSATDAAGHVTTAPDRQIVVD